MIIDISDIYAILKARGVPETGTPPKILCFVAVNRWAGWDGYIAFDDRNVNSTNTTNKAITKIIALEIFFPIAPTLLSCADNAYSA